MGKGSKVLQGIVSTNLGRVGGDSVEDVDEEEEEDDEDAHPTSNLLHRDEEGDPGYNDKETWGPNNFTRQVVLKY